VGLLQHVALQRSVLISFGLFPMLLTVTDRVFLSMFPLLVPIGFGWSQQLVCGSTFSAYGGGRQVGRQGRGDGSSSKRNVQA
jgi:hypothetical protein